MRSLQHGGLVLCRYIIGHVLARAGTHGGLGLEGMEKRNAKRQGNGFGEKKVREKELRRQLHRHIIIITIIIDLVLSKSHPRLIK